MVSLLAPLNQIITISTVLSRVSVETMTREKSETRCSSDISASRT
jgi:hypothetical protein